MAFSGDPHPPHPMCHYQEPEQPLPTGEERRTEAHFGFEAFEGLIDSRLKKLWKNRMPLKLKVFLWLALRNRLRTGEALKKRGWKGDSRCILCGVEETVDHIFFGCAISSCIWSCFKEALG